MLHRKAREAVPLRRYLSAPIRNGFSPVESQMWTGVQMLGLGCLTLDGFKPRQLKNAPFGVPASHSAVLRDGDLLVSRANTRELVGLAGMYRDVGVPCIYPDLMMRLVPSDQCLPEFLEVVLRSMPVRRRLQSMAQGTSDSMVKISAGMVSALPVPLLPLVEQRRIVDVLDALADVERAIEASIAKARLVRGELLRALMKQEDWPERALGEVATVTSGSTPSRARADFWNAGIIPWVKTAEINFSVITDTSERITKAAVASASMRLYPKCTVLIAMYGEGVTRGRTAILGVEAAINQAAAAVIPDSKCLDHQYLYYWLESSYGEIRKIGQGSNQTNLNGSLVEAMKLPVPPLAVQRRVVEPLAAFDAKLRVDREELAKLRKLKQGLADDLLAGHVGDQCAG